MELTSKPLVSIVVLSWNKLEATKACLTSIRNMSYLNREIVVVDNGSTDGSKEYLQNLTDIVYVDNPKNEGFTGGHIAGLRHSQGEFILILNNDALIAPDFVECGLKHFADPLVSAVGGRAYLWDDQWPAYSERNPFYSYQNINPYTAEGIFKQYDGGEPEVVNSVSGSATLLRRSWLEEYGYFYQPFFAYFEETDLFARMKRSGYKIIYEPRLCIWHRGGESSSSYFQYKQLLKNRFIFAIRNFQPAYFLHFLKSYLKLSLPCLWLQFKDNELQTMHKAYARAFLTILVTWPRYAYSRLSLTRMLGRSSYNDLILKEQVAVSIVCDAHAFNAKELVSLLRAWVVFLRKNPTYELVIVSELSAKKITITMPANLKFVRDSGVFQGQTINLGWLCSTRDWIYFGADLKKPGSIDVNRIASSIAQRKKYQYLLFDTSNRSDVTVQRRLLERCGGLPTHTTTSSSYDCLAAYAQLFGVGAVHTNTEAGGINKPLSLQFSDSVIQFASQRLQQDKQIYDSTGRIDIFFQSHRHVQQLYYLFHWALSPKISTRLKLARVKNLVLGAVSLRRKVIAIELRHIKNEVMLRYGLSSFYAAQTEKTKSILEKRIAGKIWSDIPVFVICRDRLEPLQQLISSCKRLGLDNIILIDNDSAYPPLLDFYKDTKYQVCNTGRNVGHTSPWVSGFLKTLVPDDFYIVTDPDVIPIKECPDDAIGYLLDLHEKYFWYQKIGFGLKIDDLPDYYTLKDKVIAWEKQFWKEPIAEGIYGVPLDTTFAVYKPFNFTYFLTPSIRTGYPYEARHLPWYANSKKPSPEEQYYKDRANALVTTWSGEELHERYLKEIERMEKSEKK